MATVLPTLTPTLSALTPTIVATAVLSPTSSASPSVVPSPRAITPTVPPPLPPEAAAPAVHVDAASSSGSETFILNVPFRSQYDNSPYQYANCGPASLGMVLEAYGANVPTAQLRALADQIQGTSGYDDGVALDTLAAIAHQAGLKTVGLSTPDGHYRRWTMGDLIVSVRHGYPVITLVHYASLPGHAGSSSTSDHYIVVVGVTPQGFVIDDPAYGGQDGAHLLLRPDQLLAAWRDASIQSQAAAFLPPSGQLTLTDGATASGSGLPAASAPPPVVASGYPSPATAVLTARSASPPLGPPPPPPGAVVQDSAAPAPSPSSASTSGLGLASQAWAAALSGWNHASGASTTQPLSPTPTGDEPTMVLGATGSGGPSPWPAVVVLLLVGGAAITILKAPGGDEF